MSDLLINSKEQLREIFKEVAEQYLKTTPQTQKRTAPFSKKEVMKFFNVTAPTLDRWHSKGLLKKHKIDRKVVYNPDDVFKLYELKNS